jgi:hypothetical protein
MKIKEIVERDCCVPQLDFIKYKGLPIDVKYGKTDYLKFCKHCGQLWNNYRAVGDMDSDYHEVRLKETE